MHPLNTITCGNCLDIIGTLADESIDGSIIDPPYGEGMGYAGDDSVPEAGKLLVSYLGKAKPKLKPNAHVAIFWTMRSLDVCIDALRACGLTYRRTLSMYLPRGGARPYLGWLPRTQAIVIGQKYLPSPPTEFHGDMAQYLAEAVQRSGLSRSQVARHLGCNSRLVMKWTRVNDPAWCLPTPRFYGPLKKLLCLDDTFDLLLTRQPTNRVGRNDFEYKHDTYVVNDKNETMLHPSQKPLSVVRHLVQCIAPKGGVVLDGFAGSGTTAVACRLEDRQFVAVEVNEEYCGVARKRLAAERIPFPNPI